MTKPLCPCGEHHPSRAVTMPELLAPHRLVALLTARPELSGVGLVRLAEATLECA